VRHAQASHAGSVLVAAAGMLFPRVREVARRMIEARLPAMFELRPYVEAGGLVSYGADIVAVWRRAAGFVDRILKGAKAADLPVEQPTRFELVVNVVTAAALGINVPAGVLLEAKVVRYRRDSSATSVGSLVQQTVGAGAGMGRLLAVADADCIALNLPFASAAPELTRARAWTRPL